MKYIVKQSPPPRLVEYRRESGATYDGLRRKRHLRETVKKSLAEEQGYICCYCGKRISGKGEDTQIEHIYPKGNDKYGNQ